MIVNLVYPPGGRAASSLGAEAPMLDLIGFQQPNASKK